jgi:hypothetical protein
MLVFLRLRLVKLSIHAISKHTDSSSACQSVSLHHEQGVSHCIHLVPRLQHENNSEHLLDVEIWYPHCRRKDQRVEAVSRVILQHEVYSTQQG